MTAEHAARLFAQDHEHKQEISTYAMISLAAILPFEPSQRSLEIARYNYGNLEALAFLAAHELLVHGIFAEPRRMESRERVSHFLHRLYREVTQEARYTSFIGALLDTKDEIEKTGHTITHVIAVTKLHKGRKATVFDLAPRTITNPTNPLAKKVPLEALDRRITQDEGQTKALALVGLPLSIDKLPIFLQNDLERRLQEEEVIIDEIERQGREIHLRTFPWLQTTHLLAGRTKRRYRLDRRLKIVE